MSEKVCERRGSMDADYKEQQEWEEYWYDDWIRREEEEEEEEDAEIYVHLRIPPRKLGWSKENKFFGRRKKGPHGWHAHPRRKRLTARRKRQAREINRQYREFGKKVCHEAWQKDAASNYRKWLLESAQTLNQNRGLLSPTMSRYRASRWRSSWKNWIEAELQAETAQGASTSWH